MRNLFLLLALGPLVAAASPERCHQIDAGGYSFAIETAEVPAVYAEGFHALIMNRVWARLNHPRFQSHPPGLLDQFKLAFRHRFVTLIDPHAFPRSFRRNPALTAALVPPHRLLVYVYEGNLRVPAHHPHHRTVRRVLENMVVLGELSGFDENPNLKISTPVTGCD